MASEAVQTEIRDGVSIIRFDDGKANALSPDALGALRAALDAAEKDSAAVALVGRPGRFSAGFDLSVMRSSPAEAMGMVRTGAELFAHMILYPRPIAAACTGHAVAAGSLVLLASDFRIGTRGAFKIGLNETSIAMTLPTFAIELARLRLSKRHLQQATVQARMYAPEEAVDAGYLDVLVDAEELEARAIAEASRMAALDGQAFARTKAAVNGPTAAAIRDSLDELGPPAGS